MRFPPALAQKTNLKSLHSPAVPPQPYSHSKSLRLIQSHLCFQCRMKQPDICPSAAVVPLSWCRTLTRPRSTCLHPASIALFIRRHRLNLPATLRLHLNPLEDIAYGAAHVFMRVEACCFALPFDLLSNCVVLTGVVHFPCTM